MSAQSSFHFSTGDEEEMSEPGDSQTGSDEFLPEDDDFDDFSSKKSKSKKPARPAPSSKPVTVKAKATTAPPPPPAQKEKPSAPAPSSSSSKNQPVNEVLVLYLFDTEYSLYSECMTVALRACICLFEHHLEPQFVRPLGAGERCVCSSQDEDSRIHRAFC